MSIFSIDNLCLAFGTHVLLDHASFSLEKGERVCLFAQDCLFVQSCYSHKTVYVC